MAATDEAGRSAHYLAHAREAAATLALVAAMAGSERAADTYDEVTIGRPDSARVVAHQLIAVSRALVIEHHRATGRPILDIVAELPTLVALDGALASADQ